MFFLAFLPSKGFNSTLLSAHRPVSQGCHDAEVGIVTWDCICSICAALFKWEDGGRQWQGVEGGREWEGVGGSGREWEGVGESGRLGGSGRELEGSAPEKKALAKARPRDSSFSGQVVSCTLPSPEALKFAHTLGPQPPGLPCEGEGGLCQTKNEECRSLLQQLTAGTLMEAFCADWLQETKGAGETC